MIGPVPAAIGQLPEMASDRSDNSLLFEMPRESNDMRRVSASYGERLVVAFGKQIPIAPTNFQQPLGQGELQLTVLPVR